MGGAGLIYFSVKFGKRGNWHLCLFCGMGKLTAICDLPLTGGSVFVANDVGEILFTSEEQCLSGKASDCNSCSEAVREAVEFIKTRTLLKNLVNEEIHYAKVQLGGLHYSIDSSYQSFQGMKMAVVTIIPCYSFWHDMDRQTQFASVAISALVLGLSALGCIVLHLLMDWIGLEMTLRSHLLHQTEARNRAEASRDAKTAFLSHMRCDNSPWKSLPFTCSSDF